MKMNEPCVGYSNKPGVLLVNLGTPDAPTSKAVARYLRAFLSDPRVVDLPAWAWRLFLNLVILPIRSPGVAKKYGEIWTHGESPLRMHTQQIAEKLEIGLGIPVKVGMRYGNPSIQKSLLELEAAGVQKLLVLPLFPQYSSATTASVFDAVAAIFKRRWTLPTLHFMRDYHNDPGYINALAESVKQHWATNGRGQCLLIAFHGLPKRYIDQGDPYRQQCEMTAHLLADTLGLQKSEWQICYQSRFGKAVWLEPYAASLIADLPKKRVKTLDIISPGFAVDCLETLEELCMQYRQLFLNAGGEKFMYIPALNASKEQIDFLKTFILRQL